MSSNVQHGLPVEILIDIFLWVAVIKPVQVKRLCLVARAFRTCIQPELYRTVVLSSVESALCFLRTIETSSNPDFSQYTSTLIFRKAKSLPGSSEVLDIQSHNRILTRCSGLRSLFWCTGMGLRSKELPPTPNLRYLSVMTVYELGQFTLPPTVTHLSIYHVDDISLRGHSRQWRVIANHPSLTHVAVWMRETTRSSQDNVAMKVAGWSATCKNLQMLVVAIEDSPLNYTAGDGIADAARYHNRIVPMGLYSFIPDNHPWLPRERTRNIDALFGYDYPVPGEDDIWTRTERIRSSRTNGPA
ncbi:hypothetical protein CYLTODRAFT_413337 [Cylindrobasidium torrendii FP15055 ss-10]|uniref:Uncharacterized protein n=1 Tax=Cylindrobasidium torrendii FP15055 ss-10 TaxID=1314674 RepID=A0A0D7B1R8_9AGAR|nr:hypothetical protein CYLTODRAFT_413337 [Cylindrobasidium torrendii FP15055 ss-10]